MESNWKRTFFPFEVASLELPVGLDVSEHLAVFHRYPKIYTKKNLNAFFHLLFDFIT